MHVSLSPLRISFAALLCAAVLGWAQVDMTARTGDAGVLAGHTGASTLPSALLVCGGLLLLGAAPRRRA